MPAQRPVQRDKNHIEGLRAGLYCRVSRALDTQRPDQAATDKSTEDQKDDGLRFAERRGLTVAGVYSDPDISASRFAVVKYRPDFERMVADVKAGKLDLIWFWELSRSQRRLGVFADLRDLCRDRGVLWAVGESVYDCASYEDMMLLGVLSIVAEGESEIKSKNVRRGVASNAAKGLPIGPVNYGYRRFYTDGPPGRRLAEALDRQDPDGLLPGVKLAPGEPPSDDELAEDSPAWIVRQMFRRFAMGEGSGPWSESRIAYDLNQRGIPTSRPPNHGRSSDKPEWRQATVKKMLRNPVYIGLRVHQGQILQLPEGVTPAWPPLVSRDLFWAVQDRYADPARKKFRTGNGPYLLSTVVRCEFCRKTMQRWKERTYHTSHYACGQFGCYKVSIAQEALDEYVQDKIVLWLSDPGVYTALTARTDSAAAESARAEASRLRVELEEVRALAEAGEMSPVMAARSEKAILGRLTDAERLEHEATVPSALIGNIGPKAAARWLALDIPAKREIIRAVADITILGIGKGKYLTKGNVRQPIADRVAWRWLLGPDGT